MSNARDKANIPALNFSATGIDDNATSTAITIDSGERVRIGNTSDVVSPSYTEFMVIGDYTASQDNGITFLADATNSTTIGFTDDTHSTVRGGALAVQGKLMARYGSNCSLV